MSAFAQPGGGPGGGGPPPPPPLVPLPPAPIPAANPLTPAKVILGKILFWEEQLSSDDTVACGTCHLPEFGGSDVRSQMEEGRNPGLDLLFGSADDVMGSPGVAAQECDGEYLEDDVFGWELQVTGRKSPSSIMAAYSPRLFWDGRATPTFVDPETGVTLITGGGALESQAIAPILASAEMACADRTWDDVRTKLEGATPMALAVDVTPDMSAALASDPDYPALFDAAFGSPDISAARIAFAIASYERTLVPNQAVIDNFIAIGPAALTPLQNQGLQLFGQNCLPCHSGPEFTDNIFHNIGVRPNAEDLGRQEVTGLPQHAGQFRTPSLRNVALRAPYFHNGGKQTLAEVVDFYNQGGDFDENLSPLIEPLGLSAGQRNALVHFMETTLTDPRVEQGLAPFDHPTLRPSFRRGDVNGDNNFDIADPIGALDYLFGATTLDCLDAADSNDDGAVNVADVVTSLTRIFEGGQPLPAPSDLRRGPDPTADGLDCF